MGITEREFPHIVEMVLPVGGLDARRNREIATSHSLRNIRPRFGRRRTVANKDYSRWCFSDPEIAEAFRKQFGGERVTSNSRNFGELHNQE